MPKAHSDSLRFLGTKTQMKAIVVHLCFALLVKAPGVLSFSVSYAKTGTCENIRTDEQRCALQASDCEPSHVEGEKNVEGERWYSAYRMEQRGFPQCSCGETTIGACLGVGDIGVSGVMLDFRCAPHPESCHLREGETFGMVNFSLKDNAQCTCSGLSDANDSGSQSPTLYGACRHQKDAEKHFCAYSSSNCEEGYDWIDPSSVSEMIGFSCTCENTRVGGCVGGFTEFICAVSQDDCDWDTYFPPATLKEKHGYDCRLCKPQIGSSITSNGGIEAITFKEVGLSRGTIAGIVLGVVVGCITIAFAATLIHRRLRGVQDLIYSSSQEAQKSEKDQTINGNEDDAAPKVLTRPIV